MEIEDPCPICHRDLVNKYWLACTHVFCFGCIKRSLETSNLCPLCRTEIQISQNEKEEKDGNIDRNEERDEEEQKEEREEEEQKEDSRIRRRIKKTKLIIIKTENPTELLELIKNVMETNYTKSYFKEGLIEIEGINTTFYFLSKLPVEIQYARSWFPGCQITLEKPFGLLQSCIKKAPVFRRNKNIIEHFKNKRTFLIGMEKILSNIRNQ